MRGVISRNGPTLPCSCSIARPDFKFVYTTLAFIDVSICWGGGGGRMGSGGHSLACVRRYHIRCEAKATAQDASYVDPNLHICADVCFALSGLDCLHTPQIRTQRCMIDTALQHDTKIRIRRTCPGKSPAGKSPSGRGPSPDSSAMRGRRHFRSGCRARCSTFHSIVPVTLTIPKTTPKAAGNSKTRPNTPTTP